MEERCQGKMPVQELSIILKFLIPDSAAGSIIGKGGATVNELQTQTGSRIQLSRNAEIFPGTTDRIVTLCGTASSTLGALHLIISKLVRDGEGLVGGRPQVKLVIPNASCGCIIGRGGATIRNFAVDSQADIKLSSQEHMIPGVNERVLTISGPNDCVLRAVALVATALSQDESYEELISRPLTYTIDGISVPSSAMKNNHMNTNRDF
jgi:RNA-binding protein Nova